MQVFVKTQAGSGVWYVSCSSPRFILGPYPSEKSAFEIKHALDQAYLAGKEEIRDAFRELMLVVENVAD